MKPMLIIVAAWLVMSSTLVTADEPSAETNMLGMKLVPIPAGEFVMGTGEEPPKTREDWEQRDWDEVPAHQVSISQPFLMSATEVTNAQYEQFDPKHKELRGMHGVSNEDNDPVVMVTWQQAVDFCNWLSKEEGQSYRLPTEAEWEYACRAGTSTRFNTGDELTPEQANFGIAPDGKPHNKTVAVGSYPANAWGLFEMHGNVSEWCHDWFGPYEASKQTDPVGRDDGWARVVRGWSYQRTGHKFGAERYCRSSNRSGHLPDDANRKTGFRVVRGPLPGTEPLPIVEPPLHQQNVRQTTGSLEGPDPAQPYFEDISEGVTVDREQWGPIFGYWNHFSAITVCPNGDVLAVWYSTVSEAGAECAQAATRLRADTKQWDQPSFFFGTPDCNTHAPVLLSDGQRLYHFCTQSFNGWDDVAECMRTSDDNGATWSRPRIILTREDPLRMSQPCSAFVAKDGKLVLAVDGDYGHRDERVMLSSDRGDTWKVAQGDLRKAAGQYAIHPAVVQRSDGAFLAFLRGPHPMPAFLSNDEGETWQPLETTLPGISVGQKAAALKLASGALLLCSFDTKRELFGEKGGSTTFAALSLDDGQTWSHLRQVDGPRGYLSLAQAPNGLIYLLGPSKRDGSIHCVAFNECWLKEGSPLNQSP